MSIAPFHAPRLVALVGGSGFIGTVIAESFAAAGWRVVAVCRTPDHARHLKSLGDLGQVGARFGDVRQPKSLAAALRGADAVVNLVGILDEKGGQRFADVHVAGAANVARAAADAGARTLVHMSAIGADTHSRSAYGRTKAEGEKAARSAFPGAAIVRPSVVFGAGDDFTNRLAGLIASAPAVPVIAPETRFQPVFVKDVAAAILAIAGQSSAGGAGSVHELVGPETLNMRELVGRIADMTGAEETPRIDVPQLGAKLLAGLGFLPGAPLSGDQFEMLRHDNVASGRHPGLGDLGIEPTALATVAPQWLVRYRQGGRFTAIA